MKRMQRLWLVITLGALVLAVGAGPVPAQTDSTDDTVPSRLQPTATCSQADIDQLERVISFVTSKSWAEDPGSTSFLVKPDTEACRVVLQINKVSPREEAKLQAGGEGRLAIERVKDKAKPSRLPLILWVVFGGAGLVFVFRRYGRR